MDRTKLRFDKYGKLLCGAEGLPHLIVYEEAIIANQQAVSENKQASYAGEFVLPAILLAYFVVSKKT